MARVLSVVVVVAFAVCPACSATKGGAADAGDAGGDAAACPDEHGAYSISVSGAGCGDLDPSAAQCVQQVGCSLSFISNPAGASRALNGSTTIGSDGSFIGASITEGSTPRSGCTGTWDNTAQTLTVDCGGTGSSQSCVVTMVRTGSTCP